MREATRDWFLIVIVMTLLAGVTWQKTIIGNQNKRIERQRQVITELVIQLDQTKKQLNMARKNCPAYPPTIPPEPLKRSV